MRMFEKLLLLVTIIFLINHPLIGGAWHEYLGVVSVFLVLMHLMYVKKWSKTIFDGGQAAARILNNFVSLLIVASMLTTIITGCLISNVVFPIIALPRWSAIWMHELHQSAAYISFILTGVHFGLHWELIRFYFEKKVDILFDVKTKYPFMCYIGAGLIISYAVYGSFLHHMGDRILMEHMVSIGGNRTPVEYGFDLTIIFMGYAIVSRVIKNFMIQEEGLLVSSWFKRL